MILARIRLRIQQAIETRQLQYQRLRARLSRSTVAHSLAPGGFLYYGSQNTTIAGLAQCTEEQAVKAVQYSAAASNSRGSHEHSLLWSILHRNVSLREQHWQKHSTMQAIRLRHDSSIASYSTVVTNNSNSRHSIIYNRHSIATLLKKQKRYSCQSLSQLLHRQDRYYNGNHSNHIESEDKPTRQGPSYSGSVKLRLPPSPPPIPTRHDTVKDIHGFFPRLYAHIKYTLMKRHRPWSIDDILALFSWIFMSNAAFILVGTTTFASLLLALANSLQFQEFIAQRVGEYLTYETGVQFVFESAIVPNWRDGKIRLRNVVLSRGPQQRSVTTATATSATTQQKKTTSNKTSNEKVDSMLMSDPTELAYVTDGTSTHASNLERETSYGIVVASPLEEQETTSEDTVLDTNLTMFRLTVDQVEVTLNMMRWFDGKGLLEHVSVSGIRGTIDRSHVFWDQDVPYVPAEHRHPSQPGDFELNSFSVNDLLVTIIQPGGFRPFKMSVISAHVPRLRKQWLFYDLLCADSVVGVFDECLFSMHRAQRSATLSEASLTDSFSNDEQQQQPEQRMSELRIDGINIDHLNAGVTGPFGWITSATVDISAHITFPIESDEDLIGQLLTEWVERIDAMAAARKHIGAFHDDLVATIIRSTATKIRPVVPAPSLSNNSNSSNHSKLIIDLGVRFNNVKASVPLVAEDISYLNNALIRPVVAYMNWHRTCIPVRCSIGIDLNEFDGSWTVYESGLVDTISEQVGRALVQLTTDERERNRRLKRVGLWGLQSVTRNLISVVDYARGVKGFWEYTGLIGSH